MLAALLFKHADVSEVIVMKEIEFSSHGVTCRA
jgi:hypothetical protein